MGYYQEILMGLESGLGAGTGTETYRWYVNQFEATALEVLADRGSPEHIANSIFDTLGHCLATLSTGPEEATQARAKTQVEVKEPRFGREITAMAGFRWFANKVEIACLEQDSSRAVWVLEVLQNTLRELIALAPGSDDCINASDCYGYWICCDGCCKPRCRRIN